MFTKISSIFQGTFHERFSQKEFMKFALVAEMILMKPFLRIKLTPSSLRYFWKLVLPSRLYLKIQLIKYLSVNLVIYWSVGDLLASW